MKQGLETDTYEGQAGKINVQSRQRIEQWKVKGTSINWREDIQCIRGSYYSAPADCGQEVIWAQSCQII